MQSQSINTNNYSYNSLGFSLQTSSGDVIDLNMYDERSASISHEQSGGTQNTMLSLSHAYGYNFHYEGDGIDENDQKEIDAAMKLIQPQIDEYLSNVQQSSETVTLASAINTAYEVNQTLPSAKDQNTQNYTNNSLLKMIDQMMEQADKQNEKVLEGAQKLFESVLKQQKGFELYV
ncbi:hypothetical protein [Sulfurospirillum cavolei]|uniref:hypothetical protein n=1 Tax=Sulfurospirillum cavolei TaxID=366522 RepID=UPI0007648DBA|nr:hypothetical protein [Sulfurospirillum cavolei]